MKLKCTKAVIPSRDTKPFKLKKYCVLVSYFFLRKLPYTEIKAILENPKLEVLLDSGAFSAFNTKAEVDVYEYIEFVKDWEHALAGYIMLDVIGNPELSKQNLQIMLDSGLTPLPVHVFGDTQKRMNELYEHSDYVCFPTKMPGSRMSPPLIRQKMEWAAGRKVHWLGTVDPAMIEVFKPWSCDASTMALQVTAFGLLNVYVGKGNIKNVSKEEFHYLRRHSVVSEFISHYDEIDLQDRESWNGQGGWYPLMPFGFLAGGLRQKYFAETVGTRVYEAMLPHQTKDLQEWVLDRPETYSLLFK